MKIGIDIRCLAEGRKTGVEEYTLNLLQNIFETDGKNEFILFFNSFKKANVDFSWIKKYPNVSLRIFRFPNKILNFLFWYFNWPKIDRMLGGADVIFMPNIIFGGVSEKTKLIMTTHDLSFERYPETFSLKRKLWHMFVNPKKICEKADRIIAISNSTKSDICLLYGIRPEKIAVVYSGISDDFQIIDRNDSKFLEIKEKYKLPYNFILFFGTIEPRKNIIGLIRAYNQLRNLKNPEFDKYKLVISGSSGWKDKKIFAEIKKSLFAKDIIFAGFVDDADKAYIYNLASLFVYPSFFEGFGFPPLEAMKCGAPVIAANNSSLPEIIDGAGVMIDPDRSSEIFQAMREILSSREMREKMREKGISQSKKFNWRKAAEESLRIILDTKKNF